MIPPPSFADAAPDVPDPEFEVQIRRGKARSPTVPFDPYSPYGRKHPTLHTSSGSVYKCRKNLGLGGPDAPTHPYRRLRIAQGELEACHVALRHRQRSRSPTTSAYDRRSDVKFLRAMYGMCRTYARVLAEAGAHYDAQVARGARSASEVDRLRRNAKRLSKHIQRHHAMCKEVGAELERASQLAEDAVGPARRRLDFAG